MKQLVTYTACLIWLFFLQPYPALAQGLSLGKEKPAFMQKDSKEVIVENFNAQKESILKSYLPDFSASLENFSVNTVIRDSLTGLLKEKGELKIGLDSLSILQHLDLNEKEEQYLANVIFSVNRLGAIKSLNYVVKKGDTIRFSYVIQKGAGWDELEVLEAKEVRYTFSKTAKNVEQSGEFVAKADGIIIFNLTNRGLTRSKGKLIVSRKEMQQKLSFIYSRDTIRNVVKEIKQLQDTITEVLVKKNFSIPSKTDITQSNRVKLSIPVPPGKIPIAIAYWFGSNEQNRLKWQELSSGEAGHSLLEKFIAKEIFRNGSFYLPEEGASDLLLTIKDSKGWNLREANGQCKKTSYASPTLNHKWNYACFSIQRNSSFPEELILEVQNNSTLYATETDFEMIGFFLNDYQAEVETTVTSYKEYLTIKTI